MEFGVGSIVDGKVTGITKFGAFVALPEGKSGLVHISEIAHTYVNEVSEHLSEGQEVQVKIIGIDENNRVNLSIKKATEPPPRGQGEFRRGGGDRPQGDRPQGGYRQNGGGDRPQGDRPQGDRPQGGYRQNGGGDRPQGDRPQGGFRPSGGGDRPPRPQGQGNGGGGYRAGGRPPVYAARPAPKEPTDFEDKLKMFMQNSDSKLAEMRHIEKKGSRRGRK